MVKGKWVVVIVMAVVVLVLIASNSLNRQRVVPGAVDRPAFVAALTARGIQSTNVRGSKFESFFPDGVRPANLIETSEGNLEVVFFTGPTEAEQVRVAELKHSIPGRHSYQVTKGAWSETIDAAYPLWFTTVKNLFVISYTEKLDTAVKQSFGVR